jgi:type IV fimbrial biogenesis protein FimT
MRNTTRALAAHARGLTLIEVLTVVGVMAIITAVAAPGMRTFGVSQKAKSLSYDLVSDLLTARSESLKRNRTVTVTPLGDTWASGWSVAAGATVISQRQPDLGSVTFEGAPNAISFNNFGRVASPVDPVRMTVKPLDPGSDATRRCIELDPSGYARSKLGSCS